MFRQSRSENIDDLHEFVSLTDRAFPLDVATYFASRANEFRMGIAHISQVQHTAAKVGQHRRARQPVVDMAFGATRGSRWDAEHSTNDRRSQLGARAYVTQHTSYLCSETQSTNAVSCTMSTPDRRPTSPKEAP